MSSSEHKQSTPKELSNASLTFALPKSLRDQLVEAAWQRRITTGELLRRIAADGLDKLTSEHTESAIGQKTLSQGPRAKAAGQ